MIKHNMKLDSVPFEMIKNGTIVNDKINCSMSFRAKRGIFERFFVTSFLRMTKGHFH
ncbi:MAG: hypothetical protein IIT39_01715 [Clostridia bacterium]|nr:hypothetical protein [Clostridia bacterium]